MNFTLKRTDFRSDGIFGELLKDDGSVFCVSLEHAFVQPDGTFAPAVPLGAYVCQRGMHQLAHMNKPFETFELTNVPGHTNILLHRGNYNNDSEGCILLGTSITKPSVGDQMISSSGPIFNKFMSLQNGVNEFTLIIED